MYDPDDLFAHPTTLTNVLRFASGLLHAGGLPELSGQRGRDFAAGMVASQLLTNVSKAAAKRLAAQHRIDPAVIEQAETVGMQAPLFEILAAAQREHAANKLPLPRDYAGEGAGRKLTQAAAGALGAIQDAVGRNPLPATLVEIMVNGPVFHGGVPEPQTHSLDDLLGLPMNFLDQAEGAPRPAAPEPVTPTPSGLEGLWA